MCKGRRGRGEEGGIVLRRDGSVCVTHLTDIPARLSLKGDAAKNEIVILFLLLFSALYFT